MATAPVTTKRNTPRQAGILCASGGGFLMVVARLSWSTAPLSSLTSFIVHPRPESLAYILYKSIWPWLIPSAWEKMGYVEKRRFQVFWGSRQCMTALELLGERNFSRLDLNTQVIRWSVTKREKENFDRAGMTIKIQWLAWKNDRNTFLVRYDIFV